MIKKKIDEEILQHVYYSDYLKGKTYFKRYIRPISSETINNLRITKFSVESERTITRYSVIFRTNIKTNTIETLHCTCPQFESTDSCKHIAACLYNYYEEIIPTIVSDEDMEYLSKDFLDVMERHNNRLKSNIKEEVQIEFHLSGNNEEFESQDTLEFEIKIGTSKLYSCKGSKISMLLRAIETEEEMEFGKNFTYNPETCYIDKKYNDIFHYLSVLEEHNTNYYYNRNSITGRSSIKNLLSLIHDKKLYINEKLITEYKESFPYQSHLIKENDKYKLNIAVSDDIHFLTGDYEYVQINDILYHLNDNEKFLLEGLYYNNIDTLVFKEDNKNTFTQNVLPIIHKNLTIQEGIEEFKITDEVHTKLFFDLSGNKIICNMKLIYDDVEIDYFDKNSNIMRNKEYEEKVLEDILTYKFNIHNNRIELDNMDDIGEFFEENLQKISEKYEVFTTENFKKVSIIKKPNVKSTFSIGKDNIMSYSFDIDNLEEDEIVNILKAYQNKKKYYRLNSGDLMNIENNEELQELNDLMDDLSITDKDIKNKNYEIPKYKAIYLDGLKNHKYHIIDTNNLFNELIDKFRKYKNSNISLSKKEEEVLRNYQKEGVKWLYNIDKTGFGGILADEMGLGKSIQTIYYIKELLKENDNYKFLIVSPTSLAYNWEKEFDKFEPKITKEVLLGTRIKRREKMNHLENINVLITTYGLVREDKEYYEKMNFKTIIIDEAQNIKNYNAEISKSVKNLKAETKFALTGTPIENSIDEVWSIYDFIMPGMLPDIQVFDKKFKIKDFDEEGNKKLEELNRIISPFILRRKKKDVIKDLPPKIENNIYVELTKEQKKLYLAELEKVNKETESIMATGGINKLRFMILQLLTKLRQICINPNILYKDYSGGSGKMEEFIKVVETAVENHHKILIFTSFKEALLLAKKELTERGITSYVIDGSTPSKKRIELVDKFNADNTNVFFIMLKAGGTGLNLTSADIVIHLDLWWNPQAENQATDRTHRIGQTKTVEVIKFISKGTIEEKILELQNKKKILSEKLIDENSAQIAFNKLTEEDIKDLLTYTNELE